MSDLKEHGRHVPGWGEWVPCGCERCSPPEHKARKLQKLKRFQKKQMARARRRAHKNIEVDQ